MAKHEIGFNGHHYSLSLKTFKETENISKFMRLISIDQNDTTKEKTVAAMEAKNYPIYMLMYHPELNLLAKDEEKSPLYEAEK